MQTTYLYITLSALLIIWNTVNAESFVSFYFSVCPDNCNTCENYDKCTSCKTDKWNLNVSCVHHCNNNCLNQECQDDNGYCLQCKTGLYDLQCQRDCSLCANALCDLRACTLGCKSGYFAYSDGSETYCQRCRSDCRTCSNSYDCDVCNDGFYLFKTFSNNKLYGRCLPCSDSSQSCKDLCFIQDCNKCQVLTDTIVCTECREGYEFDGDVCVLSTTECSQGCLTSCDDNGICLGSCNNGWTGEHCSETCASQCLTCTRNNANLCEQCKEDFYTTSCNIKCPDQCTQITSQQTCNTDDGYCLNGCNRTLWGPFCNNTCPDGCIDDGISKICHQSNGSCTLGCKYRFAGTKCDSPVSTMPTVKSEVAVPLSNVHDVTKVPTSTHFRHELKDNDNNSFISGYFSGLGSAAMIACLIVAIFCIRRRIAKTSLAAELFLN